MEAFPIVSFEGGMADGYLAIRPNQFRKAENLLIDENKKLYTRPGLKVNDRLPVGSGAPTVSGFYGDQRIFALGARAFSQDPTGITGETGPFNEILGPQGASALCGSVGQYESAQYWRRQLIVGMGMSAPKDLNDTTVAPPGPPKWLYRLPVTGLYRSIEAGLPALSGIPTPIPVVGGPHSYAYAFHYQYTFTDFYGTTFQMRGPVFFSPTIQTTANPIGIGGGFDQLHMWITGLSPTLTNTASTNYDVSNITIEIYRTLDAGQTFFHLASVANGGDYTDNVADDFLKNLSVLYTDGGALSWDQPPATGYVAQVNDFFWYAGVDSSGLFGITHSIQGNPGASPGSYFQNTDQAPTGLSSIGKYPILFCTRAVYRVEGNYDETGQGGFQLSKISDTAGCISNRSIVAIPGGLVWAGNGGFYYTDGTSVQKISKNIPDTYKQLIIEPTGAYDPIKNLVYWTCGGGNTNNPSMMMVLHLNFGISEESAFTTLKVPGIFPSCVATDAYNVGRIHLGDNRGYWYSFDDNTYSDPHVDVNAFPSEWYRQTIIYGYESPGFNFGSDAYKNNCIELTAEIQVDTDIAVSPSTRKDDGGPWKYMSELRQDGAIIWSISDYPWDDPADAEAHDWDSMGILEGKRGFPSGTMRSTRRQIGFTNSMTNVSNSDTLGTLTASRAGYITLDDLSETWPNYVEEYYLDIVVAGVTTTVQVIERISDTELKVVDYAQALPAILTSGLTWTMKGYRKNERFNLLSYTVHFDREVAPTQLPGQKPKGRNA